MRKPTTFDRVLTNSSHVRSGLEPMTSVVGGRLLRRDLGGGQRGQRESERQRQSIYLNTVFVRSK